MDRECMQILLHMHSNYLLTLHHPVLDMDPDVVLNKDLL